MSLSTGAEKEMSAGFGQVEAKRSDAGRGCDDSERGGVVKLPAATFHPGSRGTAIPSGHFCTTGAGMPNAGTAADAEHLGMGRVEAKKR